VYDPSNQNLKKEKIHAIIYIESEREIKNKFSAFRRE
jgi:hypothetical protein